VTARPVPAPIPDATAAVTRMAAIAREHGLTDTRAALAEWRAVDRTHTADTAEWWEATLRLRDRADRAERETRA
jgi:hypothetical protein